MKTIPIHPILLTLFSFFVLQNVNAQTEEALFAEWNDQDKAAVEALVMYPEETRIYILEATQYPELLIKVEGLQETTSNRFQQMLAGLSKEDQEMIYDLSRYPGLITQLAYAKEVGEQKIIDILKDYPEVIHKRAKEGFEKHGNLLGAIEQLDMEAETQFLDLLNPYPEATQAALKELIELPEVLNLLTENIRMTILIGDLYKKDPLHLKQQMDSLNLVVAEANAKELENWQESVEQSPEVREDLKSAAQEFAEEYGYDDDYYEYDDMYAGDRDDKYVVEQYFYYNYPYWFGYPSWYYYPRWRPYPFWYESGFYVVLDGGFFIHRLPSFYFTHWYFHRPYHHYYYPYLSRRFVQHAYYGPRRHGSSSIAVSVRSWQERNQDVITDNWLREDYRGVERFREFGKFEIDRDKYNRKKPQKQLSPSAYLERNRSKYPDLYRSQVDRSRTIRSNRTGLNPSDQMDQNRVPQKRGDPVIIKPRQLDRPTIQRRNSRVPDRTRTIAPRTNVPKINRGANHHRTTIERSRRSIQPRVTPRTMPRSQNRTIPKSKTKTRSRRSGG